MGCCSSRCHRPSGTCYLGARHGPTTRRVAHQRLLLRASSYPLPVLCWVTLPYTRVALHTPGVRPPLAPCPGDLCKDRAMPDSGVDTYSSTARATRRDLSRVQDRACQVHQSRAASVPVWPALYSHPCPSPKRHKPRAHWPAQLVPFSGMCCCMQHVRAWHFCQGGHVALSSQHGEAESAVHQCKAPSRGTLITAQEPQSALASTTVHNGKRPGKSRA